MKKIKLLTPILTVVALSTPLLATACNTETINKNILNSNLTAASYVKFTFSNGNDAKVSISGETVCRVKSGKTFATVTAPVAKHSDGLKFKNWVWVSGQPSSKAVGDTVESTDVISSNAVVKPVFEDLPAVRCDVVFCTDIGYFTKSGVSIGNIYVLHDIVAGTTLADAFDPNEIDLVTDSSSTLYGLPAITATETEKEISTYQVGTTDISKDTVVNSQMTVKANWITAEPKEFTTCDWSYINSACETFEASDQGSDAQTAFCNKFKIDGSTPTSMSDFVGLERTVSVNGIDHTVRVVDTMHDKLATDESGTESSKYATLTFEFKNFICDSNGYSLATVWQNAATTKGAAYDYLNSTLRATLDGRGSGDKIYVNNSDTVTQNTTFKSMIDTNVSKYFKDVVKRVVTHDGSIESSSPYWTSYSTKTYTATLFNATGHEMGYTTASLKEEGDSTYKYWTNHSSNSEKIHRQINTTTDKTSVEGKAISGFNYSEINNYAGYNYESPQSGNYGSNFWLSSPYVYSAASGMAYYLKYNGNRSWSYVDSEAHPVSPNFCI